MFAGHCGVGTGAKAGERMVPLWALVLAVQWLDVVWATLVLLDVERVKVVPGLVDASDFDFTRYPWSHSLTAALGWSALAYGVVRWAAPVAWRSRRSALLVALAVFSHWPLDLIVHRSDMPVLGDSVKVGLDLWSSAPATFAVETLLVAAGLALYLHVTAPRSTFGRIAPWGLGVLLLCAGYSTVFGDSSDATSAAAGGLVAALVLFPAVGWLVDWRRRPRPVATTAALPAEASPTVISTA